MGTRVSPWNTNPSVSTVLVLSTFVLRLVVIQGASRETDVFEMDVTEQVEGVEAWVGGS